MESVVVFFVRNKYSVISKMVSTMIALYIKRSNVAQECFCVINIEQLTRQVVELTLSHVKANYDNIRKSIPRLKVNEKVT